MSLELLSWIAIALLSLSYWFQIYKIHKHKEVRDLSAAFYILLAIGFSIMSYRAWVDDTIIFMVKQISTLIPSLIIIGQIYYHQGDHWHDEADPICTACDLEGDIDWKFCAYCGERYETAKV